MVNLGNSRYQVLWFDTYFISAKSHGLEDENNCIFVHEDQVDDKLLESSRTGLWNTCTNLQSNFNLKTAFNQHLNEPNCHTRASHTLSGDLSGCQTLSKTQSFPSSWRLLVAYLHKDASFIFTHKPPISICFTFQVHKIFYDIQRASSRMLIGFKMSFLSLFDLLGSSTTRDSIIPQINNSKPNFPS